MSKIAHSRLLTLLLTAGILAGCTCAVERSPYDPVTFRQWYEMPVVKKQTYLEDTIPSLEMQYDEDIPELAEGLDKLFVNCDRDCRERDMTYILENLNIQYTIR